MKRKIKNKYLALVIAIIILGTIVRIAYSINVPVSEMQHDIAGDAGHLAYILTIYSQGKLPMSNKYQFYHPPLYHLTAAAWIGIEKALGVSNIGAIEGIQDLTLVYSIAIMIVAYEILETTNLKNRFKLLVMTIMAFHPTFIILSGSINNDILTFLNIFIVILYLIKWNKDTNIKNTIILAIFTGLSVMTKLSGALMAIPISIIFIKKIIEFYKNDKKRLKCLFIYFVIFGIISLSLGLWHPIRNMFLFNQEFGYVPNGNVTKLEGHSFVERFLSIYSPEFVGAFCNSKHDYNLVSYIIKSSLFGEFSFDCPTGFAIFMKYFNTVMIAFSLITALWTIAFKKEKKDLLFDRLIFIIWLTFIVSHVIFCIKLPYTCSMDFRYIVPTLFCGIYFISSFLEHLSDKKKTKNGCIVLESLVYVFSIFCIVLMCFI